MARLLMILVVVCCFLAGIMIVRFAGQTYRLLPVEVDKPLTSEPFEEWRAFVSAIGKFQVMLPTVPQHATEDLPVPDSELVLKYDMYISETNDGTTFMISLITYPEGVDTSKPEGMLENVMNEMVAANPTNKLRSLQFFDFKGYKALDFFIASPEIFVGSRAFVAGKTLYLLTVIDKVGKYKEESFKYFVESFELLPEEVTGKTAP